METVNRTAHSSGSGEADLARDQQAGREDAEQQKPASADRRHPLQGGCTLKISAGFPACGCRADRRSPAKRARSRRRRATRPGANRPAGTPGGRRRARAGRGCEEVRSRNRRTNRRTQRPPADDGRVAKPRGFVTTCDNCDTTRRGGGFFRLGYRPVGGFCIPPAALRLATTRRAGRSRACARRTPGRPSCPAPGRTACPVDAAVGIPLERVIDHPARLADPLLAEGVSHRRAR